MRRRAWHTGAVLLAVAAVAALVAALAGGLREAAEQEYWAIGHRRLVVDAVVERFDRIAPVALGAAAALALLLEALRRWRRREPLPAAPRAALVLLAVVGALRAAVAVDAWRVADGPNVLLISIDTLRADHLGTYGAPLPTSPTIDRRLAGEGVTFEEVYSQSCKTTPSHMTMLTSLYPSVHGIEMWAGVAAAPVLHPAVPTLAETLKNAGYATVAFTGGANVHRARGFGDGFDVYKHGNELPRTLRWLERHPRGKFFLFFHTYAVHDPYLPPDRLIALFDPTYRGPLLDTVRQLRDHGASGWEESHARFWASVDPKDPATVRFVPRLYDAGVRNMDESVVAPLLDALDRLGLAQQTLVVFTSDHGEAFGEHGAFQHDDLYAGTLHVPLILRFPGRLAPGRRISTRARIVDVMPTVLALLSVPPPPTVEGASLVPLLDGATPPADDTVSELIQSPIRRVYRALRRDDFTYVVDGSVERVFDRTRDPGESTDVASTRPDLLVAGRTALARWRDGWAAAAIRFAPRRSAAPDAATLRRLRALGYVE